MTVVMAVMRRSTAVMDGLAVAATAAGAAGSAEGATAAAAPPAADAAAPALPAGWIAVLDEASGATYYFNEATGQSVWNSAECT